MSCCFFATTNRLKKKGDNPNKMTDTENTLSAETALQTSTRYHRLARSWAMTDPVHAKVELVTNSVDAWRHLQPDDDPVRNTIEIEEDLMERKMYVRDFAIGLSAEKMASALMVIGARTAESEESRGTFSSGAKNVAQLGQIWWLSAHKGRYSECYITTNETGAITIQNDELTEERRALLKLPDGVESGTTVVLEYAPHVVTDRGGHLFQRFFHYFAMRDIFSIPELTIRARYRNPPTDHANAAYLKPERGNIASDSIYASRKPLPDREPLNGEWSEWFDLRFTLPNRTLLTAYGYTVPEYPEATAYFEIYKTDVPLPVPEVYEEDTLQFGFSICTSKAIHEHSCLTSEIRRNEDARHLVGRLHCDYIDRLLLEYDLYGPTQKNPVAIIDPNRLYGLNRSHPFVQWLISGPMDRTKLELRKIRDEFDSQFGVSSADVLNLVGELEKMGNELFESQDVELSWRSEEYGRLVRAVEQHEQTVFVRRVDVSETYNPNAASSEQDATPVYIFSDQALLNQIEESVFRNASGEQVYIDRADVVPIAINERGSLQALTEETPLDVDRVKRQNLRVEIIYTDSDLFTKRFRATLDGSKMQITINIRSPCFMGQLSRNEETKEVTGLERVGPVLIETLVHAFARVYTERKIESAIERNVVHLSNASAGEVLKYPEEYEKAVALIEKEIYTRVGIAIQNGALEDDGVVTLDEVMNV